MFGLNEHSVLNIREKWWSGWDLNPQPPACKAGALPLSYHPILVLVNKAGASRQAKRPDDDFTLT